MLLSQNYSPLPAADAVLLSVKPKYSDLILAGQKRVEFRRVWAANDVRQIAVYSTAPVQRVVALVSVNEVVCEPPSKLWSHCAALGGGLTKRELLEYFQGKPRGFAILLGQVRKLKRPVDPRDLFSAFTAPQSFRYLTLSEVKNLSKRVTVPVNNEKIA